jgi:ComF family protein
VPSPAPYARFALELLLAALAPPRCAACDHPVPVLAAFCAACASSIEPAPGEAGPPPCAAFAYAGPIARAIARFKYEHRPDLARPLGDLLSHALSATRSALVDRLVVPVPLHPTRLAERGYNQSALLARRVGHRLGLPCLLRALARNRDTRHQARLDRASRAANAAGAFVLPAAGPVRGRRVLLVDDVRTTGATLRACRAALLAGGAADVTWAVVAQAERLPDGCREDIQ